MEQKIIATIMLVLSTAGVIACCYASGKQFELKNYRGALGLLGCAASFYATILGIML